MPLTDTAIKALRPKDKSYRAYDSGGLYLEISPSGSKLWRLKYRFQGKEKRLSFGAYPGVSLREARRLALEAKEILGNKEDPASVKQTRKPVEDALKTFSDVAEEWVVRRGAEWSEGHRKTVDLRLRHILFPAFGDTPIIEITPAQVLALIRNKEEEGKIETAHRALGICSQVMRYGVGCGYCPSDPCRDLRGVLTTRTPKPQAAITTPKEAGALMASIDVYQGHPIVKLALRWSAYTFARPGEVRHAEWSEIDWEGKEWRIPQEKMKMRQEHRVPLAHQCMEILEEIRRMRFSERWIFATFKANRPLSENGILTALRRMGYTQEQMTAHGFRAMASTLLNEMGFRPDLIERQLAHGDTNKIRAVYNRAAYMDERRAMMQKWADYLDQLKEGCNHLVPQ